MNKKVARITNDKKLLLGNEVVEGNRYSLNEHGKLYTKNILEGNKFSIDDEFIEVGEFIEGYPFIKPVIDDSLVLWLDGSTGNNYDKTSIWKDLSGNGNDGKLINFDFTEDSGWVDGGLKFDGVDDYVQLPDLDLNPDNFTIQVDDNIVSFRGDNQAIVKDREVKIVGRNLFLDGGYETISNATINMRKIEDIERLHSLSGLTLTISLDIKSSEPEISIDWYFRNNSNSTILPGTQKPSFIVTNEYERFSHTFVFSDITDVTNISFAIRNWTNADIYSKNIKLEIGSIATDWTPALEDITETNIINHTTPFVKNNTIHTFKLYNRALTDEEIMQNYQAGQCSPLLAMRGDVIG